VKEQVINAIIAYVPSLPVATVILATLPILELRGALPVAILGGMSVWEAYPLAVFGNMIPIPFIIGF
jgi:hypothetical protein